MTQPFWSWLVTTLLVVLGVLASVVFFRYSPRKANPKALDIALFRSRDKRSL